MTSPQVHPLYRPGSVVALLLLITGWRVLALAVYPFDLYPDEVQYWDWSRELAFGYFSKPPMVAWLIGLGTAVAGTTEFGIKLAAPFIHLVTALLVWVLARDLFGPRAGFWSALTYALLPAVSLSSLIISTDPPMMMFWAAALIALLAAFLVASAASIIKALTVTERPLTVMVYFAVPASFGLAIPAAWVWITPTWEQLAGLALVGVLATTGQYSAVRALRVGEATAVVPFDYLQLPLSGVLGFLIFAELPTVWTVAGALVIAGSTLYIALREARLRKAPAPARE